MKAMLRSFIDFVEARELMRLCKESGMGPPYSDDSILRDHHFCNINREHDYVTRWIDAYVRVPCANQSLPFTLKQLAICRAFNEPTVLKLVCPFTDVQTADAILRHHQNSDGKIMRGAYMMPPHGSDKAGKDVITYYLRVANDVGRLVFNPVPTHLAEVARALETVFGLGPFLVNQIIADLRYTGDREWDDWDTFVLCGIGTRRGLNRYHGLDISASMGDDQAYTDALLNIRHRHLEKFSETVQEHFRDPNNLANSFCEYDKYMRAVEQISTGQRITLRRYKTSTNNSNGNLS